MRASVHDMDLELIFRKRPILRAGMDRIDLVASGGTLTAVELRFGDAIVSICRDTQSSLTRIVERMMHIIADRRRRVETQFARMPTMTVPINQSRHASFSTNSPVAAFALLSTVSGEIVFESNSLNVAFFQSLADTHCVRLRVLGLHANFSQTPADASVLQVIVAVILCKVFCCVVVVVVVAVAVVVVVAID